ncbi:MAG: S-adenosylmethionine:tRNA ribosyltransferase-isomerase, partial [Bacteroidales bacterium]|nr:S-adenosylmethionine:tRNA ribosyltransferase-isomerase [Bacteroidales bacterium]
MACDLTTGPRCPQRHIDIADYRYPLPEERIALYPSAERDASKLLVYRGGEVRESCFARLGDFLPADTLLVMNDTKVVHARLVFHKGVDAASVPELAALGARIEIFCLEPLRPVDIAQAFAARGEVEFLCLIGNNKKWKGGDLCMTFTAQGRREVLRATRIGAQGDAFAVRFSYAADLSFSEVLEASGKVPLPPYIRRQAEDTDAGRYQTVFARHDGSVAAPTAGLHFTENLLAALTEKGIAQARLTLHVGAGTFKPVKEGEIGGHAMHREYVSVPAATVAALREAVAAGRPVVPVGTTSMRSLESLYWWGVSLLDASKGTAVLASDAAGLSAASGGDGAEMPLFELAQWTPYETYGGRLPYPPA